MLCHASEPLAPTRVDTGISGVTALVLQPSAGEALARRSRAARDSLKVLATADDALRLESLPDDVTVLLGLPPDLLENGVDVEELEERLPTAFEGGVETFVNGSVEARRPAANRQHMDADDEEAGLRQPGLVVHSVAALACLRISV